VVLTSPFLWFNEFGFHLAGFRGRGYDLRQESLLRVACGVPPRLFIRRLVERLIVKVVNELVYFQIGSLDLYLAVVVLVQRYLVWGLLLD
jgi:hypothetical protein